MAAVLLRTIVSFGVSEKLELTTWLWNYRFCVGFTILNSQILQASFFSTEGRQSTNVCCSKMPQIDSGTRNIDVILQAKPFLSSHEVKKMMLGTIYLALKILK